MSNRAINEGVFADVYGVEQWVTLRGESRENPVLLMIPGPGAGFSPMALYFESWERDYTVAQWDQPRAGATLAKHGAADTGPYTFDRLARGAEERAGARRRRRAFGTVHARCVPWICSIATFGRR